MLFNLDTYSTTVLNQLALLIKHWRVRVEESADGVGVALKYKLDNKLFRRYSRNAMERKITGCLFAYDQVHLVSTRRVQKEMLGGIKQQTLDLAYLSVFKNQAPCNRKRDKWQRRDIHCRKRWRYCCSLSVSLCEICDCYLWEDGCRMWTGELHKNFVLLVHWG